MKRIIAALFLMAATAAAQTTNEFVVNSDGTNLWSKGGGTYKILSDLNMTNLTVVGKLTVNKAELSLDNISQTFTAAAGYEVVTNFTTFVRGTGLSVTSTSIVNNTQQDLAVFLSMSAASDTVNTFTEGHLFTNGVEVSRIGWSRKIAVVNDQGSAAGNGVMLDVPAGVTLTFRIDVDKNATLDFDHLSVMALQQ